MLRVLPGCLPAKRSWDVLHDISGSLQCPSVGLEGRLCRAVVSRKAGEVTAGGSDTRRCRWRGRARAVRVITGDCTSILAKKSLCLGTCHWGRVTGDVSLCLSRSHTAPCEPFGKIPQTLQPSGRGVSGTCAAPQDTGGAGGRLSPARAYLREPLYCAPEAVSHVSR